MGYLIVANFFTQPSAQSSTSQGGVTRRPRTKSTKPQSQRKPARKQGPGIKVSSILHYKYIKQLMILYYAENG